jgi:collagenase-like PrtC family protease
MKISLGPLLYYWQRDAVFTYYDAMAETPVDIVYLGETVCSRRHELRLSDWLDIASRLRTAGKEVILSTQVLLESGAEVGTMHKITGNGDYLVEANDMGAVQCLAGKVPFVAGPHLNIYNLPTLQWMAGLGATRWVMPLEMKRSICMLSSRACRPVCKRKCLSMDACRWPFLRAALLRATAICPRMTADSVAWIILTD